ncbi:hypothetical protein EYC98_10530 [Halieaceae bacterium IMCC14734]|uniref:Thymidylate kinase n=1 Tax=Candidatus Litorirhabdus singularis TaxID=2518993 RepID=A0ABT3TIS3_9GAMM|nr:hypothetical protein [Candidatus Litorirhabdus singularis]MCX2981299.1 hypothetical protein [Candidatus Litorirhabdus singularis]
MYLGKVQIPLISFDQIHRLSYTIFSNGKYLMPKSKPHIPMNRENGSAMNSISHSENDPAKRIASIRNLFNLLDQSGITWAIRGEPMELFSWVRAGSRKDIDIWVPLNDMEMCIDVAISAGGVPVCSRPGVMGKASVLSAIFVFIDVDGSVISMVDFNGGPSSAGIVKVSDEETYINSIQRPAGVPRFSGGAILTDSIVRRLVRGKGFTESRIDNARSHWKKMDDDGKRQWLDLHRNNFNKEASAFLTRILQSNSGQILEQDWRKARNNMLLSYFGSRPFLLIVGVIDKLLYSRKPRQRTINPAGARPAATSVAIIGTDGTGKSSTVSSVEQNLRRFCLPVEIFYFGRVRGGLPGVEFLQKKLSTLFTKKSGEVYLDAGPKSEDRSALEKATRWIGSYFYVLDYFSRYVVYVFPSIIRRKIIVFDRYVYDLKIMPYSSRVAALLIEKIVPKPSLICFLDVDENTIFARRKERTLEEVVRQQDILRNATQRNTAKDRRISISGKFPLTDTAYQLTRAAITVSFRKEIQNLGIEHKVLADVRSKI